MTEQNASSPTQTLLGAGVILIGLALGAGAVTIPSAAGYGGAGPNFLPWLVSIALTICGVLLVREARTGGFRNVEPPSGAGHAHWSAAAWIAAGLLANAALITTVGFVLSCTLCYVLAVQGLRRAEDQVAGVRTLGIDVLTGLLISAPVYWAFTKFLAINLPGLTDTGWI